MNSEEARSLGPDGVLDALASVRSAAEALRRALDASSTAQPHSRGACAEEMTGALAQRDRHAEELQQQADARLAALEEATAALHRLHEEVGRLTTHLAAVSAENEQLRAAAQERLELLRANDRAYAEFKAHLKQRLAEVADSID